jgi:hypothetical protein
VVGGHAREARRRLDLETAPDGDEHLAGLGDGGGLAEDDGVESFTEHDGRRLEDPAALETGRIVLTGVDPGEGVVHGPACVASGAHETPCGAVQFEDLAGGHPGELMQSVDVLRDDPHGHPGTLQLGHRPVRGVGLGPERARLAPHLPRPAPDLGIAHVVLVRDELLGLGILPPEPVGTAIIGDPGIGGDACPAEDGDEWPVHGHEGTGLACSERPDIGRGWFCR